MRDQIRRYQLKPGSYDEFFASWRDQIVPIREQLNFSIPAAWHDPDSNEFIWIVRWNGEGSFEEADQAYYESPQRAALPRQFDHVASQDVRMFEPVYPA
jgi:hypothetical protein